MMDIESLREIIELAKDLGVEAKGAFIWYMVFTVIPTLLIKIAWFCGAVYAFGYIARILKDLICAGRLLKACGGDIAYGWGHRGTSIDTACETLKTHYPKDS